jgi:hypothetical protein
LTHCKALSTPSADVLQIARPDRGPLPPPRPPRSEVTTNLAKSQVEEAGGVEEKVGVEFTMKCVNVVLRLRVALGHACARTHS